MLFVVLVYDVDESRVARVLKVCRKYLTWIQRSVFQGEITEGNLELLKNELSRLIKDEDSIVFYLTPSKKNIKREVMGAGLKGENFL
jgi:CRISPR-associated protein Cas2